MPVVSISNLLNRRIFFEKQVRLQLLQSARTVFLTMVLPAVLARGIYHFAGVKVNFPQGAEFFGSAFFVGRGKSPLLEVILPISGQGDLPFGLGGCSGKRPEWMVNGINWGRRIVGKGE